MFFDFVEPWDIIFDVSSMWFLKNSCIACLFQNLDFKKFTLLILWIFVQDTQKYETSCNQVSISEATGYFPLGRNWPFERNERRFQTYGADYSDNEDDDTAEQKNMDKERRQALWDMLLEQVDNNLPKCISTILELSNPNIFMLLSFQE